MPFVFESSECAEWEDQFFWTPRIVKKKSMADPIVVDNGTATTTTTDQKRKPSQQQQVEKLPPRAEVLLSCKPSCSVFML